MIHSVHYDDRTIWLSEGMQENAVILFIYLIVYLCFFGNTVANATICLVSVVSCQDLDGSTEKGLAVTCFTKDVALNRIEWQRKLYES